MQLKNKVTSIFYTILLFLSTLLITSTFWIKNTFNSVSIDEIIFHLKVPLTGSSSEQFISYTIGPLAISILVTVLISFYLNMKKIRTRPRTSFFAKLVIGVYFIASFAIFISSIGLNDYILSNMRTSTFIEENYVDPNSVNIEFPEDKRNLVYIILESYETTYTDKENGGVMEHNLIGELKDLAYDNIHFSNTETLGGPQTTVGSTWTIGALVSQSSGLPLKLPIEANSYGEFSSFMPGMTNLGDILDREGYNQFFMLGSDFKFAGRDKLYTQHGNYDYFDYVDAKYKQYLHPDYWVWWCYEDEKLFEFSKEKLTTLAAKPEPFNFTMLTADTHFADGYPTEGMATDFDTQYENVIMHSSIQLMEFLSWMQEQDFYEDTTVVIVGDHLTMDANIIKNYVPNDYTRTIYNTILNSPKIPINPLNRDFTTLDLFPTILSSMGVEIQGHKLGLGTDLFTETETLSEEFGLDYINQEFSKRSDFYNNTFIFE